MDRIEREVASLLKQVFAERREADDDFLDTHYTKK